METILLVAASPDEFAGLRRRLKPLRRLAWPVEYAACADGLGKRWLLVANGMGPNLAAGAVETARRRADFTVVASVGFCGGLAPVLRPEEVFVASTVLALDTGRCFAARLPRARYPFRCGTLISVDRVVQTPDEKAELHRGGAEAVEMEAAAVAERAARWNLPFYCVRVVTDTAAEGFFLDFNPLRTREGRLPRWKIVAAALRRPSRVADLLRLRNRCRRAALALGEFLAGCEF